MQGGSYKEICAYLLVNKPALRSQRKRLGQRGLACGVACGFADAVAVGDVGGFAVAGEGDDFSEAFLDVDVGGDFLFGDHEAHGCVVVVGVLSVAYAVDCACWNQVANQQGPDAQFLLNLVG